MNLLSPWHIDTDLPLPNDLRRKIRRRAHTLYAGRPGARRWVEAMIEVPIVLGWFFGLGWFLRMLEKHVVQGATFAMVPLLFFGVVAIAWLNVRVRSRRFVNLALREYGYDVCIECGYWLRGLGEDVKQCPECGAPREAMPPGHPPTQERSP